MTLPHSLRPIRIGIVGIGCQGYRIYSTHVPAITLSAYGGGICSKMGLYLVGDVIRKLLHRECLNVQGFPDWYEFHDGVSDHQRWKQTGNSVSVPVLQKIVEAINEKVIA